MPWQPDAVLLVAFGGPEGTADVAPFLEHVLRGRRVPPERVAEVATHYDLFGGVSPINGQNRHLASALSHELARRNLPLPVYLGNRNWHPFLAETLAEMGAAGVRRAYAIITSPFTSYSSCRQYLENVAAAREEVGPAAPEVRKLRAYFNHPGFVAAATEVTAVSLAAARADGGDVRLVFTAHSVPTAMGRAPDYAAQLAEVGRLVADNLDVTGWTLAFQSRSGPPHQPWLEPSVDDVLRRLASEGAAAVVLSPIGFVSDHMEVVYDLDVEARDLAEDLGVRLVRAATVGVHPRLVGCLADLVEERLAGDARRPVVGHLPAEPDVCAAECCLTEIQPPPASARSEP